LTFLDMQLTATRPPGLGYGPRPPGSPHRPRPPHRCQDPRRTAGVQGGRRPSRSDAKRPGRRPGGVDDQAPGDAHADHRRLRPRDSRYGAAWQPRRASSSPPAGCRPASINCPRRCLCFGGPEGFSLSAPADGREPGRRRATAAAAARRPIGGACGPVRAALKTYRNFAQTAGSSPVVLRLMRYTLTSVDA
jgi:hypothetical protein